MPADLSKVPKPAQPRPLLLYNGDQDPVVKYDGGRIGPGRAATAPVASTVQWWVSAMGASATSASTKPIGNRIPSCHLEATTYPAQSATAASVTAIRAYGAGHAMPSIAHPLRDTRIVRQVIGPHCAAIEGAVMAWDFFQQSITKTSSK